MNGPIILNDAREQMAEEIAAYREPKPTLLKISPWLAMSLLQKARRAVVPRVSQWRQLRHSTLRLGNHGPMPYGCFGWASTSAQ
jgi:hypothetical protein